MHIDGEKSKFDLDRERLRLDQQKLDLERERLELERRKSQLDLRQSRLTAFAIFVPLLVAMGSIAISLRAFTKEAALQREQARNQFDMTAAQIVVNNNDPDLAYSKAKVLSELFPGRFSPEWIERFNPKTYCMPAFDDRITFAKLAIEHPDERKSLVSLWLQTYCQQENSEFTKWLGSEQSRKHK